MTESIFWLIALAVLLIIEIITLGLTTIWFAGGCFIAFLASMIGFDISIQILVFLVVSFIMLYFTKPIAVKYLNKTTVKTNYESLIGQEAKVTEKIDNNALTGSAFLDGKEWTARSFDDNEIIEVGTNVKVKDIVGVKLIVDIEREDVEL